MAAPASPPTIALNDIVEVTIRQKYDAQVVLNVLHYKAIALSTGGINIKEFAEGAHTLWITNGNILKQMWGLQVNTLAYVGLRCQVIHPTRSAYWFVAADDDVDTGPIGDPPGLPVNSTAVINKRTAKSGRNQHGDFFVAGMTEASQTGSVFNDDTISLLNDLGSSIAEDLVIDGSRFNPVIYHRSGAGSSDDLMQCVPMDQVRVMRRRTVRYGE